MNVLDIVILALIAFGAWQGYQRGAISEIARIVGLALAFVLAIQLMDTVGLVLVSNFNLPDEIVPILGFVVTFTVVMLIVYLGARAVQFVLGKIKLGGLNRLLGGAVGGAKWALLLSVMFLLFGSVRMPSAEMRSGSIFYEGISIIAPRAWQSMSRALPSDTVNLPDKLRVQSPTVPDPIESATGSKE